MNELRLPERRGLPEPVRDRMRVTVMSELTKPARWRRLNRARPPLAVAASVSVLAAGAMIVAQSVGGAPGYVDTQTTAPSTTSRATLNHPEADGDLDRCWEAVRRKGKTGQYPNRSRWQPVFNYTSGPVKVVAARAAGKPLFCETTYTSATVSDPNAAPTYATDSGTGAVLTTSLGTVAGVVDPSWRGIWFKGVGGQAESEAPTITKDGLFLIQLPHITAGQAGVDVGEAPPEDSLDGMPGPWLPLPRAESPGASVIDRPTVPAPDRTSTRGQLLDDCLTAAARTTSVVDTESWAPGARLQTGNDHLVMARNADGFASCWQVAGKFGFDGYRSLRAAADDPNPASTESLEVPGGLLLAGTVHQRCVRMEVTLAKAGVVEADVANATFAVLIPSSDIGPGNPKTPNVKLFDANDRVIYEGPLH